MKDALHPEVRTTYFPDRNLQLGHRIWGEMFGELWRARGLIWRLFYRDFSAKYRQTLFGFAWAVLLPLVTTSFFVFLARARVVNLGETGIPYPLFALIGVSIWQSFVGGLLAAANSLVGAASLLGKINFPRETLVISAVGQAVFDALIKAALILAAMAWYRVMPGWGILAVPLIALPLLMMCLGIGLVLSLVQGVMRDIDKVIALLMTLGLLLTPAAYPPPATWPHSLVNILNPVSPFIIAMRDLATGAPLTNGPELAAASLFGFLALALGWRVFHLVEPKIAERL
jgi:lipopolysaccharide transport system permease protein